MLVLTRLKDEKIVLPDVGVTFTIVRIDAHSVRVGIEAPKDVKILRQEHMPKQQEESHADSNPQA